MEAISRRPGTRSRSHTQMFFSLSPYFRSLHPEHEPANSEKGILVLGPRERDPGVPSAGQLGKLRSRARTLSLQRQLRRGRVLPSGPPPPALHPPPPTHRGPILLVFALAKSPPPKQRAMVSAVAAAWLLLWTAACAQSEQDFYDFKVVNIRGKLVSLEKYRGSVSGGPPRAWRGGARLAGRAEAGTFRGCSPWVRLGSHILPQPSQQCDPSSRRPQALAH